jgi:hypothetical protein
MTLLTNETGDRQLLSLAQEAWQVMAPAQRKEREDAAALEEVYRTVMLLNLLTLFVETVRLIQQRGSLV